MTRATWVGLLLVTGLLGLVPAVAAGSIYEIDYATWDVKVTDTKNVVTDAREFGFFTGPNILIARRGEGIIEIPFRKIQVIELEDYIPSKGYYPATVVPRRGGALKVEVERVEAQRFLGGTTDIGSFRIRLGQIRRLELLRLSRTEE